MFSPRNISENLPSDGTEQTLSPEEVKAELIAANKSWIQNLTGKKMPQSVQEVDRLSKIHAAEMDVVIERIMGDTPFTLQSCKRVADDLLKIIRNKISRSVSGPVSVRMLRSLTDNFKLRLCRALWAKNTRTNQSAPAVGLSPTVSSTSMVQKLEIQETVESPAAPKMQNIIQPTVDEFLESIGKASESEKKDVDSTPEKKVIPGLEPLLNDHKRLLGSLRKAYQPGKESLSRKAMQAAGELLKKAEKELPKNLKRYAALHGGTDMMRARVSIKSTVRDLAIDFLNKHGQEIAEEFRTALTEFVSELLVSFDKHFPLTNEEEPQEEEPIIPVQKAEEFPVQASTPEPQELAPEPRGLAGVMEEYERLIMPFIQTNDRYLQDKAGKTKHLGLWSEMANVVKNVDGLPEKFKKFAADPDNQRSRKLLAREIEGIYFAFRRDFGCDVTQPFYRSLSTFTVSLREEFERHFPIAESQEEAQEAPTQDTELPSEEMEEECTATSLADLLADIGIADQAEQINFLTAEWRKNVLALGKQFLGGKKEKYLSTLLAANDVRAIADTLQSLHDILDANLAASTLSQGKELRDTLKQRVAGVSLETFPEEMRDEFRRKVVKRLLAQLDACETDTQLAQFFLDDKKDLLRNCTPEEVQEQLIEDKILLGNDYQMQHWEYEEVERLAKASEKKAAELLQDQELLSQFADRLNDMGHGGYALRDSVFVEETLRKIFPENETLERQEDRPEDTPVHPSQEPHPAGVVSVGDSLPERGIQKKKILLHQELHLIQKFLMDNSPHATEGQRIEEIVRLVQMRLYDGENVEQDRLYSVAAAQLESRMAQIKWVKLIRHAGGRDPGNAENIAVEICEEIHGRSEPALLRPLYRILRSYCKDYERGETPRFGEFVERRMPSILAWKTNSVSPEDDSSEDETPRQTPLLQRDPAILQRIAQRLVFEILKKPQAERFAAIDDAMIRIQEEKLGDDQFDKDELYQVLCATLEEHLFSQEWKTFSALSKSRRKEIAEGLARDICSQVYPKSTEEAVRSLEKLLLEYSRERDLGKRVTFEDFVPRRLQGAMGKLAGIEKSPAALDANAEQEIARTLQKCNGRLSREQRVSLCDRLDQEVYQGSKDKNLLYRMINGLQNKLFPFPRSTPGLAALEPVRTDRELWEEGIRYIQMENNIGAILEEAPIDRFEVINVAIGNLREQIFKGRTVDTEKLLQVVRIILEYHFIERVSDEYMLNQLREYIQSQVYREGDKHPVLWNSDTFATAAARYRNLKEQGQKLPLNTYLTLRMGDASPFIEPKKVVQVEIVKKDPLTSALSAGVSNLGLAAHEMDMIGKRVNHERKVKDLEKGNAKIDLAKNLMSQLNMRRKGTERFNDPSQLIAAIDAVLELTKPQEPVPSVPAPVVETVPAPQEAPVQEQAPTPQAAEPVIAKAPDVSPSVPPVVVAPAPVAPVVEVPIIPVVTPPVQAITPVVRLTPQISPATATIVPATPKPIVDTVRVPEALSAKQPEGTKQEIQTLFSSPAEYESFLQWRQFRANLDARVRSYREPIQHSEGKISQIDAGLKSIETEARGLRESVYLVMEDHYEDLRGLHSKWTLNAEDATSGDAKSIGALHVAYLENDQLIMAAKNAVHLHERLKTELSAKRKEFESLQRSVIQDAEKFSLRLADTSIGMSLSTLLRPEEKKILEELSQNIASAKELLATMESVERIFEKIQREMAFSDQSTLLDVVEAMEKCERLIRKNTPTVPAKAESSPVEQHSQKSRQQASLNPEADRSTSGEHAENKDVLNDLQLEILQLLVVEWEGEYRNNKGGLPASKIFDRLREIAPGRKLPPAYELKSMLEGIARDIRAEGEMFWPNPQHRSGTKELLLLYKSKRQWSKGDDYFVPTRIGFALAQQALRSPDGLSSEKLMKLGQLHAKANSSRKSLAGNENA